MRLRQAPLFAVLLVTFPPACLEEEDSIGDRVTAYVEEINHQAAIYCDCWQDDGYASESDCIDANGYLGPSQQACIEDALARDEAAAVSWLDCVVGLEKNYSECLDDRLTCDDPDSDEPCIDDYVVGYDACIQLPENVSRGLANCSPEPSEPGTSGEPSSDTSGGPTSDTSAGTSSSTTGGPSDDTTGGPSDDTTGGPADDTTGAPPIPTDFVGTWDGECEGIGAFSGTLDLHIDLTTGAVSGAFEGGDSGTFDGTIDTTGAISTSGTGALAGDCSFDGQLAVDGIDGTWSCPALTCGGTWEASPA